MQSYLNILEKILNEGNRKGDRTGTGTASIFGHQFRHNLQDGFPLLTTKKINFKNIAAELIWFLSGSTNANILKYQGVNIWNDWATETGELGPVYGKQWTAWEDLNGNTINQIDYVVDTLRNNPDSRRILFHAWNVADLPDETVSPQENAANGKMALPPCHLIYQFYVLDGKLSAQLYIRSSDSFLGLPYNIASLALLTHILAQQCDLIPQDIIVSFGDLHLYNNHRDQAWLQLGRVPVELPRLNIARRPDTIYDYSLEDFQILGYEPASAISAPISV